MNAMNPSSLPASPVSNEPRPATQPKPSRLWLWFVSAFMIQAAAWTVWFTIAAQHRVEEVPLATPSVGR